MKKKTEFVKHESEIIKTIQDNPVFTFQDIFVFYKGCSRATAYNRGLDKLDSIKESIYANRRRAVTTLKAKWIKSDNPTLQIAAMRLLCDETEHRQLNQQYIEQTGSTLLVEKEIDPEKFGKFIQQIKQE